MLHLNCGELAHQQSTNPVKKVCFFILILFMSIIMCADTEIINSDNRVTIPIAGNLAYFTPNTKIFYFPGPADTLTTKLIIESRIKYTSFAGSTGVMGLMINGAIVQAHVGIRDGSSDSLCRLINKPLIAPITPSSTAPWFFEVEGGKIRNYWRVIYAPDGYYPSFPSFYTCNPYRFELDITDLVKPNVQNEIRVTNLGATYDLEIIALSISTNSGDSPLVTTKTATVSQLEYTENGLDFHVTITSATGALLKMYTDKVFPITSGSHYWVKIDSGTPVDVVATSGGILKTTLPKGTNMHVEIYAQ